MTDLQYDLLAVDLIRRTETAVAAVAALAVDTGITFQLSDVAKKVEDDLPADYPALTAGTMTRSEVIEAMARDIFTGAMYED
ncbi:hypothetical protein [Streptomyces nitrosporeus]|uniref:hypothetical protein n=1 Tax=Streptomyces nitrosporeus TaxID=28894 RepID=UPI0039A06D0F